MSGCGLQEYIQRGEKDTCQNFGCDVLVFPFHGLRVRYDKELKGESDYIQKVAVLSKRLRATVICGCETETHGHRRKSAIIARDGKIIGVSDMLYAADSEASSGATLGVYETAVGKIGVIVAGDLQEYACANALALCGCDTLVCVQEHYTPVHEVLARAWAYCLGLPVLLSANGHACVAGESGELVYDSTQETLQAEIFPRKEYHVLQTRCRGKRLAGS